MHKAQAILNKYYELLSGMLEGDDINEQEIMYYASGLKQKTA